MRIRKKNTEKLGYPTLKTNLIKTTVLVTAIVASVGVTFPSFAEVSSLKDVDVSEVSDISVSGKGSAASSVDIVAQVQTTKADATNCADPTNVHGLAHAQQKTLNDMKAMILTPINTDNIFSTASKGGCFNALKDFPNLSTSIPSLTGIANALKDTILKYATRKVCAAVNDSLAEVIGPINELMDEFAKSGQVDLTGQVNKNLAEELYKIDPELGRVSSSVNTEYSWDLDDAWDGITGIVPGEAAGVQNAPTATDSSSNTAPQAKSSGSFMTRAGEMDSQLQGSDEEGSLTESAKNFLKSIF